MIVVSDTSPVTNLLRIGRITLLRDLFTTVVIPSFVAAEINAFDAQREALVQLDWIRIASLKDLTLYDKLVKSLDRGEAEAIALYDELSADILLIDESAGRFEAERLGMDITGLVGILITAKEKGLITIIEPELRKLVTDARFWLSPKFIEELLIKANER